MRVFLIVAGDGAILLIEGDPPGECDDTQPMGVEVIPAEPHDTIPCPPPEFDSVPDGAELFNVLCALAWHRPPVGQA